MLAKQTMLNKAAWSMVEKICGEQCLITFRGHRRTVNSPPLGYIKCTQLCQHVMQALQGFFKLFSIHLQGVTLLRYRFIVVFSAQNRTVAKA